MGEYVEDHKEGKHVDSILPMAPKMSRSGLPQLHLGHGRTLLHEGYVNLACILKVDDTLLRKYNFDRPASYFHLDKKSFDIVAARYTDVPPMGIDLHIQLSRMGDPAGVCTLSWPFPEWTTLILPQRLQGEITSPSEAIDCDTAPPAAFPTTSHRDSQLKGNAAEIEIIQCKGSELKTARRAGFSRFVEKSNDVDGGSTAKEGKVLGGKRKEKR